MTEDQEDGFVSIDLDNDLEECDICHKCTEERIIHVILSDEFTKFEGSYEKYGRGSLTKAHEICLEKWAEIIERNIKFSKDYEKHLNIKELNTYEDVFENQGTTVKKKNPKLNNDDTYDRFLDRKTKDELLLMKNDDIQVFIKKLEDAFSATSNELVVQLQTRDKLINEISGQKSHIELLVKMETKSAIKGGDRNTSRSTKANKLMANFHVTV